MGKKQDVLEWLFHRSQNSGDPVITGDEVRRACDLFHFRNQFDATKVDHSRLYPETMKRGAGHFIIHLGKGSHQFVPNTSLGFRRFEPIGPDDSIEWPYVPSVLNDFDSSEANILSVAFNQLILHDFLYGDRRANPQIYLARRTKYTGLYTIAESPVSVTQVQMEMDLVLERNGDITVFEAKNGFPDDFAVHQLFHPYLYFDDFKRAGTLGIGRIDCCYLQRRRCRGGSVLRLHLYRFSDRDLASIELIRAKEYKLKMEDPL